MPIALQNKNFAFSELAVSITQTSPTLRVSTEDANKFPTSGPFIAVIWSSTVSTPSEDPNREIIKVTSVIGDIFNIVRAQEGTSAPSVGWISGSKIAHTLTAGKISELENEINNKFTPTTNGLAWTNVNKAGALPSDIGAAAIEHSQVDTSIIFTDNTTGNVSTSSHGYTPKLPNDATKFLDGTGNYSSPISTPINQLSSDWTATSGVTQILHKPDLSGFLTTDAKGAANGVATLDSSSKIPIGQLPSGLAGGLSYKGAWNALTNNPTIPTASSTNNGFYYKVSVTGTTLINGINDWVVGDWIISNGSAWDKINNAASVTSVNGLVGAVTLAIPSAQVNTDWNASSGVAQIVNKPTTFPPSSHATTAHSDWPTSVSMSEVTCLDGVTSNIQTQISSLLPSNNNSSTSGIFGINSGGTGTRSARLNLFDGTRGGNNPDAAIHIEPGDHWLQIDNNTSTGYIRLNTASGNGTWTQSPIVSWSSFNDAKFASNTTPVAVSGIASSTQTNSVFGSPFGLWGVGANSTNPAATNSMAVACELNTMERIADQGYMEARSGRATVGLQMVPESELDLGDGNGMRRGYNGTFGISFHHSSGADYGDTSRIYPSAKWHTSILFDTDSSTHSGTQILSNGGSTALLAPNIFMKLKGYHGTGIDMSGATLAGPAIKLSASQTITDGTITKTLAQLAAAASGDGSVYYASSAALITSQITAASSAGGGTVVIGPGTFLGSWNVPDKVNLRGSGKGVTILKLPNASAAGYTLFPGSYSKVSDLTIDGNKANQTLNGGQYGILSYYKTGVDIYNVEVKNTNGIGLGIHTNTKTKVTNCWIHDTLKYNDGAGAVPSVGIWIGGDGIVSQQVELTACTCEHNGLDGVIIAAHDVNVNGGSFNYNGEGMPQPGVGAAGVYVYAAPVSSDGCKNINITGITTNYNTGIGIDIPDFAESINVVGCTSAFNNNSGINFAKVSSGTITGNTCYNNGQNAQVSFQDAGISVKDSSKITVCGNTVYDNQSTKKQLYGILFTGTVNNCIASGNNTFNNQSSNFDVVGVTGSNNIWGPNISGINGLDFSSATFSGSAIKLGSSQTITDGTVTKTLAQLVGGVAASIDDGTW